LTPLGSPPGPLDRRLAGVELSRASVFVDFDGTISLLDTGVHLLERLADPAWREVERRYDAGEIGSRECMELEWALLPRDRRIVEETVRDIPNDACTARLFDGLRRSGAEVTIVSDGFGVSVHDLGAELGVPVLANRVDWERWRIVFNDTPPDCPCGACGTCKRQPVLSARRRGRTPVVIGDGTSDRYAALEADVVLAKTDLATWCATHGVAHVPYEGFAEVIAFLSLEEGSTGGG
jgi:2-hydroxy-3-keto-5-methylthiopentenyl-1-phosphate phosphatase